MAAVMQPPRPSMDRASSFDQRSSSFDQPRRVSPAAFPTSTTSRPSLSQSHSYSSSHHRHSFTQPTTAAAHSRSSSSASNQRPGSITSSSPYQQPYPSHQASYFPSATQQQQPLYGIPQAQQAWTTDALPARAFYAPPFHGYGGNVNQVFHQGFQQSQADFAAWAGAYQHMMMASGGAQGIFVPPTEYLHEDRQRSVSSPQPSSPYDRPISPPHLSPLLQQQHHHQQQQQHQQSPPTTQQTKPPVQPFHPYKRQPGHRPSRENVAAATVIPRSVSQPTLSSSQSTSHQSQTRSSIDHHRTPSLDTTTPTTKRMERAPSSFERERESERERERERVPSTSSTITAKASSPATPPTPTTLRTVTPLHTGPIANATNTPSPASRPSPLSNAVSPTEPEKKSLKGRFKKALNGGDSKRSTPPASTVSTPVRTAPTTPSGTSTRSATPITTPRFESTEVPLNPPSAPFAVANPSAMSSDVSLAETTRTTTTLAGEQGGPKEKKKGLFRMKNMSTDNISLSSTVSSASMMIRRMGSIGKLARRNSLAGISKIFKDKPKDEDAALPEVDGKKEKKKEKRKRQKEQKKALAAPAAVSHATAESDRLSNEDEDRALAGLSPAAKLARQHTLRSKAEQAKKDRELKQQQQQQTGEPTWDNNTQTRHGGPPVLPSIESMTSGLSSFADSPVSPSGTEVLRVQPRSRQTVVHAVNVADHEYDSDEDSSDGETIEDVTIGLAKTRLSQDTQRTIDADEEFKATWGNAWIDRDAVPKKGILKQAHSFSEGQNSRQRSSSTADAVNPAVGPFSHLPPSDPAQIDGLAHPAPQQSKGVDFAEHLDDSIGDFRGSPYQNPGHNSSAPALSLLTADGRPRPPQASRSMTVPARKRLNWAPECAVYTTYDAGTYDRRSEPATCNRLTPELAMAIKQELNAFKMEMPVHPQSRGYTHYFA